MGPCQLTCAPRAGLACLEMLAFLFIVAEILPVPEPETVKTLCSLKTATR